MQSAPAVRAVTTPAQTARDIVTLMKPRITFMVVLTAFGGYWLGQSYLGASGSFGATAILLAGTAMVVAGANALNMYVERDTDGLMSRTRTRPLPQGRMAPELALGVGLALSAISIPLLTLGSQPMVGLLAAIALVSYVAIYTPLKRRSPIALVVGAVPGALPPLMGWAAVRGTLDGPGLLLFGIMFLWQVPHFLAIATFRKDEYARAGMAVLPVVSGDRVTRHHVVRYTAALLLTSLLLVPYGIGGNLYFGAALALGGMFFGVGAWGLRRSAGVRWARGLFLTSLIYLVGIFVALVAGGITAPTAELPVQDASAAVTAD